MRDSYISFSLSRCNSFLLLLYTFYTLKLELFSLFYMDDKTVRHTIRRTRAGLSQSYIQQSSSAITDTILAMPEWKSGKSFAFYRSIQGEISLHKLWQEAYVNDQKCALPYTLKNHTLEFYPFTPTTGFKRSRLGILEPKHENIPPIDINSFDIIFIPLVAFDSSCNRMGMGLGYYDRTLQDHWRGLRIGVAYDFQRVPQIVAKEWDVPVDRVITPTQVFKNPKPRDYR